MSILSEIKSWSVLFAFVALSVLAQCSSLQEDVFVLENKDHPEKKTIVIVTRRDEKPVNCVALSNKMLVEDIVSLPAGYVHMKLSGKNIRNSFKECATLSKPRKRRESIESEEDCYDGDCDNDDCDEDDDCEDQDEEAQGVADQIWNIIFPGTKWCGSGDIASNYSDLGVLWETDTCCRAHDNCNDFILAGQTKYNITNDSGFTLLNCKCDDEFYDCLYNTNTLISNTIGNIYFNILKRSCYTKEYPLTNTCKTYRSFLKLSCKEYERNTTAPKVYMLRPAKEYKIH